MLRVALALLLVAALGGLEHGSSHAQAEPQVGVLAIGDFGVGGSRQRQVGEAMRLFEARNPAAVLVTLGDNDYTANPSAFRAAWSQSFGWLRGGGVAVAGTLGNHDVSVQRGRYQFGSLGMPGPYYRRRFGAVELFLLDSNAVTWRQTRWLAQALEASAARWKIAVFHHPAYTCGDYRSLELVVRRWVPLFERHGVQLALSGHDHNYQRFAPRRGVTYVVHGGGVGSYYPVARCPSGYPRRIRARRAFGFLYLVAGPQRLTGYAVNVEGRRTDHFIVSP